MRRREIPGGVRFVTFSCERRLPLLSNPKLAAVFIASLVAARERFGFELFAWVVMPEHVHLLVRPPTHLLTPSSRISGDEKKLASLARILLYIKLRTAQRAIKRWRELSATILTEISRDGAPRFWQRGGGFDRNVRDEAEFMREIRYIHRNPVERGLVSAPEAYPHSSVRWWMGQREGEVECDTPPGAGWDTWKGFV